VSPAPAGSSTAPTTAATGSDEATVVLTRLDDSALNAIERTRLRVSANRGPAATAKAANMGAAQHQTDPADAAPRVADPAAPRNGGQRQTANERRAQQQAAQRAAAQQQAALRAAQQRAEQRQAGVEPPAETGTGRTAAQAAVGLDETAQLSINLDQDRSGAHGDAPGEHR
jgi:hypothetical protein